MTIPLEEALTYLAPEAQERFWEAEGAGLTTLAEFEHILVYIMDTLEAKNEPINTRLALSTRLCERTIDSHIPWKLTGMHICRLWDLEPDEFVFGEPTAQNYYGQRGFVPPIELNAEQAETYNTLRRDGTPIEVAKQIAGNI